MEKEIISSVFAKTWQLLAQEILLELQSFRFLFPHILCIQQLSTAIIAQVPLDNHE